MIPRIRNKLILRLFLVALAMSFGAGTLAYFFEKSEIDDHVMALVTEELHDIAAHVDGLDSLNWLARLSQKIEAHLESAHLGGQHFVIIRLYDLAKSKILDVADPRYGDLRSFTAGPVPDALGERNLHLSQFFIQENAYLQVFAPLYNPAGEKIAYFGGIYRVDPEANADIRIRLFWTIFQVVLVVFATAMAVYPVFVLLNRDILKLSDDLALANLGILEVLGSAVEKRDRGTNSHNLRVTLYAIRLAEHIGLRGKMLSSIMKGAFLHDVGKIGISDTILLKPGPLTEAELAIMETHVDHGIDIIKDFNWLQDAMDVVKYHHEKYDGTGYRAGLQGSDIPVAARIFTIVDVFDALTNARPYREAVSAETALELMEKENGTRFDPLLFGRFAEIAPELYESLRGETDATLVRMLAESHRF